MEEGCNIARQSEEVDALQAIYADDGEFELLVAPSTGGGEVVFRIRASVVSDGCFVQVTLPSGYPVDDSPRFAFHGLRASHASQLAEALAANAQDLRGEECVFSVLQSLEDLASRIDGLRDDAGLGEKVPSGVAVATQAPAESGKWSWAAGSGADTVLKISVNSGPKVKATRITNLSELRRVGTSPCLCIDVAPSRNTENYELAVLLGSCAGVPEQAVEFVAGSRKEKASGDRQVKILGRSVEDVVERLLGSS